MIIFTQQKNYKLLAARRSELEVLSQDEPILSSEDTKTLADEIKALKEGNQRLCEQQSGESSAATKDLESQLKALNKENTRLRKIAVKGNYLF